jgi:hypothetical protein
VPLARSYPPGIGCVAAGLVKEVIARLLVIAHDGFKHREVEPAEQVVAQLHTQISNRLQQEFTHQRTNAHITIGANGQALSFGAMSQEVRYLT